jgi:hypothetical protein
MARISAALGQPFFRHPARYRCLDQLLHRFDHGGVLLVGFDEDHPSLHAARGAKNAHKKATPGRG